MKQHLYVLLFFTVCISSGIAQQSSLGISLGSGKSNTRKEVYKELSKQGFILDVSYQRNFFRHFTIKTGLSFEKKGSQQEPFWCATGEEDNPYNVHFDYYYATIPVLPGFVFGKKVKYNFYCGPYFSLLMNTHLSDNDVFRNDVIVEQASNHNPMDFGLTTGTSIEIPISKNVFIPIEIRYNRGLLNTSKERLHYNDILTNETYSEDMVVKHDAWYVMFGLKTYLSKNW